MKSIALFFTLAVLPLAAQSYAAQSATDQPRSMSAELHTKLNASLDRIQLGHPAAPWSLTAKVQYVDHDTPTESGTVRFLFAEKNARRIDYDFPGFHQIATHTTSGGHRSSGDTGDAPPGLYELLHFLQDPADRSALNAAMLNSFHVKRKGIRLDCINADHSRTTFCTIGASPAIRFVQLNSGYQLLFETVGSFQNADVPLSVDILFANIPIAHVELAYAALTPEQRALITASPTAQRVHNDSLNRSARQTLTLAAMNPGSHSYLHSISMTDVSGTSLLLRLQFDPAGRVLSANVLAASDTKRATTFARGLIGQLIADPNPTPRFANFPMIVATVHSATYEDDFPPIGNNPGYVAAPPISDH